MVRINLLIFSITLNLIILIFNPAFAATPTTQSDLTITTSNPTKRVLDLTVPLRVNTKLISDLGIRIQTDGEILVETTTLEKLLLPLLTSEGIKLLQSVPSISGYQSLRQLHAVGLNIGYDSLQTEIALQLNTEQALATGISLGRGMQELLEPTPTRGISGFINLFNSVYTDYDTKTGKLFNYQSGNFRTLSDYAINYGNVSLIGEGNFDDKQGASRSGTRLNYDYLPWQTRIQVGDVVTPTVGTQSSADLFGLSVLRSATTLNAGAPFRPTGSQSFHLTTPARVEVYINGAFSRRLELQAGDFTLQDLGFGTGSNDIKLVIEDEAGRRSELEFKLFIGDEQLGKGISEFGFNVGIPTEKGTNQPSYDRTESVIAGFFRYGVTDWLTLGLNTQVVKHIYRYGSEVVMATSYGNIALDTAYVENTASGSNGAANGIDFRLRYELPQPQNKKKGRHYGLGFTLDSKAQGLSATETTDSASIETGNQYRLSTTYWQDLIFDYRLNVSVNNTWGIDSAMDVVATLSRQYQSVSATATLGHDSDSGIYIQLGVNFNLESSSTDYQHVSVNYDGRMEQIQANYSNMAGNQIGATGYQINSSHSKGDTSLDADFNYRANRVDLEVAQKLTSSGKWDNVESSRTTYRANTAVVLADGSFSLSRPVTDSFAILSMHPSIADKKLTVGSFKDHVQYQSDILGPAVINDLSAYSKRNISFNIDDLPLGYDLGANSFTLVPRYNSGYRLNIGSGYSVILVAELLDKQGKIMVLKVGAAYEVAEADKAPLQAFTNKKGRLVVQGLRPGQWLLKFRDETDNELHYNVDIPQDAAGVVRLKTLSPSN